jgi:hypothetical protein
MSQESNAAKLAGGPFKFGLFPSKIHFAAKKESPEGDSLSHKM